MDEERIFTVEQVASICHEANRQLCLSIGDQSQKAWNEAPDWQKQSAVDGVTFFLKNPEIDASEMHENWMKDKRNNGWTYGTEKDEQLRTHPCMVPYGNLPIEQRTKDHLFRGIVKSLMPFIITT